MSKTVVLLIYTYCFFDLLIAVAISIPIAFDLQPFYFSHSVYFIPLSISTSYQCERCFCMLLHWAHG